MQAPALPSLVTVMAAPLVVLSTACVDQPTQSQCTALGCAWDGTGCAASPFGTSREVFVCQSAVILSEQCMFAGATSGFDTPICPPLTFLNVATYLY